jgi:hypothetical protein
MLLSSSKSKQKHEANDPLPRKMFKSTKLQTTKTKVILSSPSSADDEDSTKTPPRRTTPRPMTELLLKICYQVLNDQLPHLNHAHFLQFLASNVPTNMTIMNKRHETLKTAAVMALNDPEVHKNHFEVHQEHRTITKNKAYPAEVTKETHITVIQAIQTSLTLSTLKKLPGVLESLQANKIYITVHEWIPETWNVKTIGFLTKYSLAHHPKDTITETLNTQFKKNKGMPKFRIVPTVVCSTINNIPVRVQVYAIEVQTQDAKLAEKVLLSTLEALDDYVSFRVKSVNPTAYKHAIAVVAQHQNDLRTIVVNNVSEGAYYVLKREAKQMNKVVTVHHLHGKQSMRIVTYHEDFIDVRREIRQLLPEWISKLDPSDIRASGETPNMVPTRNDDLSEGSASDLTYSINSFLSLDIYELEMFKGPSFSKKIQRTNFCHHTKKD